MNNLQTPLEKLISEKQRIQQQCVLQEQKLNDEFLYIQDNAGNLLLSGVSALLFPGTKTKSKTTDTNLPATAEASPVSLGFAEYLAVVQNLLPVAWDVVRPLLITWGMRKAQTWIVGKLFKKKK